MKNKAKKTSRLHSSSVFDRGTVIQTDIHISRDINRVLLEENKISFMMWLMKAIVWISFLMRQVPNELQSLLSILNK